MKNSKEINIKDIIIALAVIALLVYKLLLASQDFPSSFFNGFQRTIIFISSIILLLNLNLKFKFRSLLIFGYLVLTYTFSYLDLWKTATKNYLIEKEKYFSMIVTELKSDSINCSIGLHQDSISFRWTKRNTKPFQLKFFSGLYSSLKNNTEVVEIEKDKYILLFVFDRFIDNGYGLAYIPSSNMEKLHKLENYKINGLEITSLANIKGNWYYISFT